MKTNSIKKVNEGVLLFTSILDTIHYQKMSNILQGSIDGIIKLLFHESILLKKSTSWLMLQITELYTKIFDRELLNQLIPSLVKCLNDTNYIAINICYSLINLIKNLGDINTVKNSSKNMNLL